MNNRMANNDIKCFFVKKGNKYLSHTKKMIISCYSKQYKNANRRFSVSKLLISILFLCFCSFSNAQNNPSSISGLLMWLRADSNVVFDPSNGTSVQVWKDCSGNGNDAKQLTTTNQPILKSNEINGLQALSFNGMNQYLSTPIGLLDNVTDLSMFLVLKTNSNDKGNGGIIGDDAGIGFNLSTYLNGYLYINKIWSNPIIGSNLFLGNNWEYVSTVCSNANGNVRTNGIDRELGSPNAQLPLALGLQQTIGKYVSTYFANADISEIILYNRSLSNSEVQTLEDYLKFKYAPPNVNLGTDVYLKDTNSYIIDAKKGYTGYKWSNGANTESISVNTSGAYSVTTIDVFGDKSSDTINIYYPAIIFKDTAFCKGNSITISANLKGSYTYLWSNGDINSSTSINSSGIYSLTVSNNGLYYAHSNSFNVTQDNFISTATFGTTDTSLCVGNEIGLIENTLPQFGLKYIWSTLDTISKIKIINPGIYKVTVTDHNNCILVDSINITINGIAPTPNFKFNNLCLGDSVKFVNTSIPLGNSWLWDFGDGTFSVDSNPNHSYKTVLQYYPILYVSSGICQNSLKQTLSILTTPTSPRLLFPNNKYIESDSIEIFKWVNSSNTLYSVLQLSADKAFKTILFVSDQLTNNTFTYTIPDQTKEIYWRVLAYNSCGYSESPIYQLDFFNKKTVNNMLLWLKSDKGVIDSLGQISNWQDQSGNMNNAIQVQSSNQPLLLNNSFNGYPTISFNGINQYLETPRGLLDSYNALSAFFVIKVNQNDKGNGGIFGSSIGSSAFELSTYQKGYFYINKDYTKPIINSNLFYPLGQWDLVSMTCSNLNGNVWENGKNVVMYNGNTNLPITSGIQQAIGRYASSIGSYYANINIAEIIIFKSSLSDLERLLIENYLRNKYAPSVNLGPDITITQSLCDTIIHAGKGFSQYMWTTGDTTESIKVSKSGYYSVLAVDTVFGIQSSSGLNITFNAEPKLLRDTTICPGTSLIWDTQRKTSNFTFLWSTGETTPSITITKAGNYLLTVTDAGNCKYIADTAKITIDNFNTSIDLGNDTTLCQYNELELQKGGDRAVLFAWSDGSTNKTLSLQASGTYYLTATDIYSCKADDSIKVLMSGVAPDTKFTVEGNCEHDSIMLTDNSVSRNSSKIIAWKWFIQNDTITEQNINYRFANPGTYYIKLLIQTDGLCSGNKTIPWEIDPKPVALFTPLSFCEFSQTPFINKSTIVSGLMLHNTWIINDTIIHDKDTINLVFQTFGKQLAKLIVTSDKNCIETFADSVESKSSPKAVFTFSASCNKNPYYLFDSSLVPPYNGILSSTWKINGFKKDQILPYTPDSSSLADTVMLTVKGIDGCSDSVTQIVSFSPIPKAAMQFENVCMGDSAHFYDKSTISSGKITNWKWDIGDSIESFVQNPIVEFKQSKTFQIALQITSDMGCGDTVYSTLKTIKKPVARFDFEPKIVGAPIEITFTNTSDSATSYKWNFGDFEYSTDNAPVHEYVDSGTFVITLVAFNDYLCADSTKKIFLLPKSNYSLIQSSIILIQKNGYVTVSTVFGNTGLNPITSIDFILKKDDGTWIKENWKGSLTTGIVDTFTFASSFKELNDALPKYICIDANVLGKTDSIVATSHLCITQTTDLESYAVYPVPADDKITITFATAIKGNVEYSIYDNMGKPAIQGSKSVDEGFNTITIATSSLTQGFYIWKITIAGKVKTGTFVIKRNN
jgi:PKD repeat protein